MNPQRIVSISIAMSVVMVGLLVMQMLWVNSALEIKETSFTNEIQRTFTKVMEEVDLLEKECINNELHRIMGVPKIPAGPKAVIRSSELTKKFMFEGDTISYVMKFPSNMSIIPAFENAIFNNPEYSYNKIDSIIKSSLQHNNIYAKYNFNVYFHTGAFFMFHNSKVDEDDFAEKAYVFPFESNVIGQELSVMIYFPKEKRYLLKEMGLMLFMSIIIILSVIYLFSYSISAIIKQTQLSELKNDFVNNMTHEFKTPISTISLACQALLDNDIDNTPELYDAYISIIDDENQRLAAMAEKILQTAILDKGELRLKKEWVNIHDIINELAKSNEMHIHRKGGNLILNLDAKNDMLNADKVHLTNLLYNLLDNANKYTFESPKISISTQDDGDYLLIIVQDNGIGISRQNQKKIFNKLYRVPTGNVHDVKGFGLGLSYVKAIVQHHQGMIDLDSQLNKGTSFFIRLPIDSRNTNTNKK